MKALKCSFCGNIIETAAPEIFIATECPICVVGLYELYPGLEPTKKEGEVKEEK